MTTDEVFAAAAALGCRLELKDGRPVLAGPASAARAALARVLRHHRAEVVARLVPPAKPGPPGILWWRLSCVVQATLPGRGDRKIPWGATAWQQPGEEEWRPVESLPPEWGIDPRRLWWEDDERQREARKHGSDGVAP